MKEILITICTAFVTPFVAAACSWAFGRSTLAKLESEIRVYSSMYELGILFEGERKSLLMLRESIGEKLRKVSSGGFSAPGYRVAVFAVSAILSAATCYAAQKLLPGAPVVVYVVCGFASSACVFVPASILSKKKFDRRISSMREKQSELEAEAGEVGDLIREIVLNLDFRVSQEKVSELKEKYRDIKY